MSYYGCMIGIRERRLAAGLSQEALATACGVSPKTIQRAETDVSYTPSLKNATSIALALGVSIDDLIHEVDSDTPAPAGVKSQCGPAPIKKRAASTVKGA